MVEMTMGEERMEIIEYFVYIMHILKLFEAREWEYLNDTRRFLRVLISE